MNEGNNDIRMKETPLVSVIVPNYNHAKFLHDRLNSILQQTYRHFELIILDDCSTDNSMEVISQYKDEPRLKMVVRNEQNSGSPFKQWNKGISLAHGELIWIAESDDACSLDFLETMVKKHQEHPDAVIAFCRSQMIDENGKNSGGFTCTKHFRAFYTGREFIDNFLMWHNDITNASSVLFKREAALQISGDYMNYRSSGDRLFWILLCGKGGVTFEDTPLNYHRMHGDNTTATNFISGSSYKQDVQILKYLEGHHLISKWNAFRVKKYNVTFIKYRDEIFKDNKALQDEILSEWNPSVWVKLASWISNRLNS